MRAQGASEAEIQRRASAMGERQSLARKERQLREWLEAEGHSVEVVEERVAAFRARHPQPAPAQPASIPTLVVEIRLTARVPRQCFRSDGQPKQAFPDLQTARSAATATSLLKPRAQPNDAYKCPACGLWHIGGRRSRRNAKKVSK